MVLRKVAGYINAEILKRLISRRSALPSTTLLFTPQDQDRLRRFISVHEARLAREAESLALLTARVESGQIVEAEGVPPDVVTMNSQVRLQDTDSGRFYVTTVALLPERQSDGGSLSHAYPSAALLGARVGDEIVWRCAGRLYCARIEEVLFQPKSHARPVRNQAQDVTEAHTPSWMNPRSRGAASPSRVSEEVRT
jgi:regulator of nucleoside diphosphate kinase